MMGIIVREVWTCDLRGVGLVFLSGRLISDCVHSLPSSLFEEGLLLIFLFFSYGCL